MCVCRLTTRLSPQWEESMWPAVVGGASATFTFPSARFFCIFASWLRLECGVVSWRNLPCSISCCLLIDGLLLLRCSLSASPPSVCSTALNTLCFCLFFCLFIFLCACVQQHFFWQLWTSSLTTRGPQLARFFSQQRAGHLLCQSFDQRRDRVLHQKHNCHLFSASLVDFCLFTN